MIEITGFTSGIKYNLNSKFITSYHRDVKNGKELTVVYTSKDFNGKASIFHVIETAEEISDMILMVEV